MVNGKLLSVAAGLFFLAGCSAMPEPSTDGVSVSSSRSSAATGVTYSLPADPEHGPLTYLAIGPLAGNGAVLANGSAVVWIFEDGTARVSIQLNIAAAPAGSLYIAWLRDETSKDIEKLGTLANAGGDVRHSLKIEALKEYKRYSSVFVTLESSEGVSMPSKIVANGILKETGR